MSLTSRREFLKRTGGIAAALGAGGALPSASVFAQATRPAGADHPNFLLFIADDQSAFDVGCYGNKIVRTPNIDRLAKEGVRLDGAFTSTAMCAPSRSMLYTGLYPHRNGCHNQNGAVRDDIQSLPHHLQKLGYRVGLAGKTHIKPKAAFPFEYIGMDQVDAFLDGAGPFCLVVASGEPHLPHRSGGYKPEEIPVPPWMVDTAETRRLLAGYYTDIDQLDRQVGRALDALAARGLERNTLTIYTADHGYGAYAKWSCYEAGLRVPFVARWPGRIQAGSTSAAMFSFADVLPAFIEAAGGTAPKDIDGRSILPVLLGKTHEHRDLIFGAHTNAGIVNGKPYPIRSVRSRTHKYIRNLMADAVFQNNITEGRGAGDDEGGAKGIGPNAIKLDRLFPAWREAARTDPAAAERVALYQRRPPEELYDLRNDPHELKNLASDPAHQEQLKFLSAKLDEWMKQQGDAGIEAEMAIARARGSGKKDAGN